MYIKPTRIVSYRVKLQVRAFNASVCKQFACTGARVRIRLTLFNELQKDDEYASNKNEH